jgi:ribosomal protein S13
MTDDERRMAAALATVRMVAGIPSKRFARELGILAENKSAELTEAQASALRSLIIRYRGQVPLSIVELARGEK